eukprot:4239763-Prymnesium_polylepis.1
MESATLIGGGESPLIMALTYARRAGGCGPRRWELLDPRDRRNEHALTRNRKARKRSAPRPGGAPGSKGSGDGSDGVVQSS